MILYKKRQFEHVLLLIMLLLPVLLRGQIKAKGEDQTKSLPLERIVKCSPLALIDPFGPTAAAYFEQQLSTRKKWTSLEHEIGYTFSVTGLTQEAIGYRLRSSYRQYFKNKWKEKGNYYASVALMHRQFFDKGSDFLWREDRSYQQNLPYHLRISQQSVTINGGITRYFGKKNAYNLDLSFGLGLRRTHIVFSDLPDDVLTPAIPDIFERNFKEYVEATIVKDRAHLFYNSVLALKLGYVLQKNSLSNKKRQ